MPFRRFRAFRNPPPLPSRIPAILRTRQRKIGLAGEKITAGQPRLWNAKRRIRYSQGLNQSQYNKYASAQSRTRERRHSKAAPSTVLPAPQNSLVSPDVAAFYDANPDLLPEKRRELLQRPAHFFSRQHNVPLSQRKQVYFPKFSITLLRTRHNSPYFASFIVPRWFSKFDLKDYLASLYGVPVVHIRSYLMPSKISFRTNRAPPGRKGAAYRTTIKKKMTVQLVEPFYWPEEVKDFAEWEKDEFWRLGNAQVETQRQEGQWGTLNPDRRHRKSMADQARDLLQGKREWKPTWQNLPADERVMKGVADRTPQPQQLAQNRVPLVAGRAPLRQVLRDPQRRVPIGEMEVPVRQMEEVRI